MNDRRRDHLEKQIQRLRGSLGSTGRAIAVSSAQSAATPSLAQTAAALQTSVLSKHVQNLNALHGRARPNVRFVGTRRAVGAVGEASASRAGVSRDAARTSSWEHSVPEQGLAGREDGFSSSTMEQGGSGTLAASAPRAEATAGNMVTNALGPGRTLGGGGSTGSSSYKVAKFYRADYTEKLQNYKKSLNLAQRLDLLAKPLQPVNSDSVWISFCAPIKEQFLRDIDKKCPICLQRFSPCEERRQRVCVVLHPCGHLYHQGCLQSYERFCEGRPPCPLCREEYSDCAVFPAGEEQSSSRLVSTSLDQQHSSPRTAFFRHVGAIRLQRLFRAFFSRKYTTWKMITFSHAPLLFQKTRLAVMRRSREQYESSERELDDFFAQVDSSVGQARDMLNLALGHSGGTSGNNRNCGGSGDNVSQEKWDWARSECLKRGFPDSECPICFVEFSARIRQSAASVVTGVGCVALLDCGHCFHAVCIESFEKFAVSKTNFKCPVCRQGPYERRLWKVARKKKKVP